MRIVQISDTHLFSDASTGKLLGLNTAQSYEAVLELVSMAPKKPEAVILTGDLSQDETPAAYHYLSDSIEKNFDCPVYWIPGNHDDPDLIKKILVKPPFKQEKAVLWGHWLFVLLNTHYSKHVEGHLSKNELSQLDFYLSQHQEQNVAIIMHHPPVSVGSKWVDNLRLNNADQFFEIVDRYLHVKAIICGHVHQAFETVRKNVKIMTTPSTCIQFKTNSTNFALDKLNPGYRWFDFNPDGTFNTGVERVTNFLNTSDFQSGGY